MQARAGLRRQEPQCFAQQQPSHASQPPGGRILGRAAVLNVILPTTTFLTVDAISAWRPDADCIASGDEYAVLAVRCYAAAGLSDTAIAQRIWLFGAEVCPPVIDRYDAALALARHGAIVAAPARQIVTWLAYLAQVVPGWPDDPAEIASMTRAALQEVGR